MQFRVNALRTVAAWALVLMGTTAAAHATPADKLVEAREAFQLGKYEEALPLLNYLLYPDVRLSRKADLLEAHVLLGVAHFELGNQRAARREFEEALFLDSELTLDPLLFSEKAIEFFEDLKAEMRERANRDAQARALAEERDRLRRALENMVVLERKPYYINFVPFGAGQFQNGHNRKGLLFFASEAILGGTSATLWMVQVSKYGLNGKVPDEETASVRRMQQVQVAMGVACLVVMGAGIVDALMNYESVTRAPADESLIDDFDLLAPREDKKSSLNLMPTAGPHSAGVVMTWEF